MKWEDCLSNESPPWVAYLTIMAVQMVALDKFPGVITLVIAEVCCRLISKLVLQAGGY